MSHRSLSRHTAVLLIAALVLAPAAPSFAQAPPAGAIRSSARTYIVQLRQAPVATYDGGLQGLPATRPATGSKIDPTNSAVRAYVAYLNAQHSAELAKVGGRKLYDYSYVLNGFAAEMTAAQAAKLSAEAAVALVEPDAAWTDATSTTPHFLGLDAPADGLWDKLGGVGRAGEDVIVGVVDGGFWPEHPSYSDGEGKLPNYLRIPGWHGKCQPGEAFNASMCNQKVIGAQYFIEGRLANLAIPDYEFVSPRDFGGHGSHTSSTAAGNSGVQPTGDAGGFPRMSGMAPRARIAVYKTSFDDGAGTGTSFTSDLAAAIDQAVADGVDVINLSIGGTSTNFLNAVQVAFFNAASVGVFVAAAAGNSGPTASTVAHPSPWITTVAAATHDRTGLGSVTLGNGAKHNGSSFAGAAISGTLIDSTAAGVAVDPQPGTPEAPNPTPFAQRVALCFLGHLDPAKAAGKIVLCDRGINARVEKSLAVKQAGGIGMILVNATALTESVNADFHFVPSVHLSFASRPDLKAYAATAGATASIAKFTPATVDAPFNAAFSSRGPLLAAGGDLLKPDVAAPGQDVMAAVAPPGHSGRLFDLNSGTSMASPHVAGVGALLKQLHPTWSPMMIKSALMTTATTLLGTGGNISPFAAGAGHINPNAAADPGLVYDSTPADWLAFICGTGQLTGCAQTIDPSDLNVPSLAIGDLVQTQTLRRTVTNVGTAAAEYSVEVVKPAGVDVEVTPSTLTLAAGRSASYTVKFTTLASAAPNAYAFGSLTWSDGTHKVRSPIAVRPLAIRAPAEVLGTGEGPASYDVQFGYSGTFAARPHGLVPAVTVVATVADDPSNNFVQNGPGVQKHTFEIPAGTRVARISLFDDFTDGNDDLDVYLANPAGTLVASSATETSAEEITLTNPAAGTYTVYVHGFETDGPDAGYTLFTWAVDPTDAGNLTVSAPITATIGATATLGLSWVGLTPGTKYLGTVTYHSKAAPTSYTDGQIGSTIIRVDR